LDARVSGFELTANNNAAAAVCYYYSYHDFDWRAKLIIPDAVSQQ
jgi:hypothetical protein